MPIGHFEELLILAKTYPNPSSQLREITCVAAINRNRQMRRLFPLPYRYLQGDQQFQKWEWVTARIEKARKDHRPESHTIDRDSIVRRSIIPTNDGWRERLKWLEGFMHSDPSVLESLRQSRGDTLGFIRPAKLLELEISKSDQPDWTEEEKEKLVQELLFDTQEAREKVMLQKVPFDFHYRYECESEGISKVFRHKITDWEAGALFWNCQRKYGNDWEKYFRARLEADFSKNKDVVFLLGTIHRFPDQWLIVAFYYPPKGADFSAEQQLSLL